MDNNNKDRQERIDRYLLGDMDPHEKTAFEQQLADDQELRKEVNMSRHIINAFQREGEQRVLNTMKNMSADDLERLIASSHPGKKGKKRALVVRMSVAAAAVICIFIYIGTRPQYATGELYTQHYVTQPYETYPSRGGAELTIEEKKNIQQARKLYEEKAYGQALTIYNQFLAGKADWKSQPEEVLFYTAISQFETGDPAGAIEKLAYLASSAQFDFQDEALWNLAFVYLKENQRSNAKDCLRQLVEKDSEYKVKAAALLEALNKKKWFG